MCKFTNAQTLFCFLLKCVILVFLGVLTIEIQNSYIILDVRIRYEPHFFDKARFSEASWFLITKIWYLLCLTAELVTVTLLYLGG